MAHPVCSWQLAILHLHPDGCAQALHYGDDVLRCHWNPTDLNVIYPGVLFHWPHSSATSFGRTAFFYLRIEFSFLTAANSDLISDIRAVVVSSLSELNCTDNERLAMSSQHIEHLLFELVQDSDEELLSQLRRCCRLSAAVGRCCNSAVQSPEEYKAGVPKRF